MTKQVPLLHFLRINGVDPLSKRLHGSRLRKALVVTDICSKRFVGVSAFITRSSKVLLDDLTIIAWGFWMIGR
jgi:hypothetical protein